MPFSQFTASLDPETLDLLCRAFDAACEEARRTLPGSELDAMRQLLAARIFQAYAEGERDPTSLRNAALAGIATQ